MDIWDIVVYLAWSLLVIGIMVLAFIIWAIFYVSQYDAELEREMEIGMGVDS